MSKSRFRLWSSVGKKLLTGLTGLLLMGFIVAHLAGNLTLLLGSDAFNIYAEGLHSLGWLVYVGEVGLGALILAHVVAAVTVWRDKRKARSTQNSLTRTKGAPSRQTAASRTMIWTGAVLLVFLVIHIWQFRFGPSEAEGYVTTLPDGVRARDLYRLVAETFRSLPWVAFYVGVMLLLGFHLRHGFWSAWQSLGALNPRLRPLAYSIGAGFALVMAIGFLVLPVYLYLIYLIAPTPLPADIALLGK